jgi:uncharacterized protein (DUF1697 family)
VPPPARPQVAFLRAVNVGGTGKIAMADLCSWLGRLGFSGARSLLQSGNLIFVAGKLSGAELERRLETEAEKHLGLRTTFFVRTADEWKQVMAHNPFPREASADPARLALVILKDAPAAELVAALRANVKGRERIEVRGRHAYIIYPDGMGTSKLTLRVIEKHLETCGTTRNWNTVVKMAAAVSGVKPDLHGRPL